MIGLDEIERLARAATPGEWSVGTLRPRSCGMEWVSSPDMSHIADCSEAVALTEWGLCGRVEPEQIEANAAYIAAANPAAILALIARLRAAEAGIGELRAVLFWAQVEKAPLRQQEIDSIRRVLKTHRALTEEQAP